MKQIQSESQHIHRSNSLLCPTASGIFIQCVQCVGFTNCDSDAKRFVPWLFCLLFMLFFAHARLYCLASETWQISMVTINL